MRSDKASTAVDVDVHVHVHDGCRSPDDMDGDVALRGTYSSALNFSLLASRRRNAARAVDRAGAVSAGCLSYADSARQTNRCTVGAAMTNQSHLSRFDLVRLLGARTRAHRSLLTLLVALAAVAVV